MGFISFKRRESDRGSLDEDEQGYANVTENYLLKADNEDETEISAALSGLVPVRGDSHPELATLLLKQKSVVRSPKVRESFFVTLLYSDIPFENTIPTLPASGVDLSEKVSGVGILKKMPVRSWFKKDDSGSYGNQKEAVVNSAGEPLDDIPENDRPALQLTVTRYFPYVPNHFSYMGKLNSDTFSVRGAQFEPYSCRMGAITFSQEFRVDTTIYYSVVYPFVYDPEGWDVETPDRGFNYKEGGKLKPILNGQNHPVSTPQLLDGSGNVISNPTASDAKMLAGRTADSLSYSGLGFS